MYEIVNNMLKLLVVMDIFSEEKADSSIPLYVLPLYSLLAPEQQAKVRSMIYIDNLAILDNTLF